MIYIERNGLEAEVAVSGTYNPGSPEVRYQSNGDPGWPAEPAEIVDIVASDKDGGEVELTESELTAAEQALWNEFVF